MKLSNYRTLFDLDPSVTYLNSGTHSITPRSILEAVTRYQRDYEKNPTRKLFEAWGNLWETQKILGQFFKADPRDLIIAVNITWPMNVFIQGVKLDSGAIAISDCEYGAMVNICKMRCEREKRELQTIRIPATPEDLAGLSISDWVQKVVSQFTSQTRLFLISHVTTGNSLKIPLLELAKETRKRGVILIVDGAHAPGAFDLDISQWDDVDFYGGNLHKWFLGPKGTAFGWVNKRHQDQLEPLAGGWMTFESFPPFDAFGGGSRFAQRFCVCGSIDFAPFFAIGETIDFWNEQGKENIFESIRSIRNFTEEAALGNGFKLVSPRAGDFAGPSVTLDSNSAIKKEGYGWIEKFQTETGVQLAAPAFRGEARLRVAGHIHNTNEEIIRTFELLKKRF